MNKRTRLIAGGVAGVVVLYLGYGQVAQYLAKKAENASELKRYESGLQTRARELETAGRIKRETREAANATLGDTEEIVQAELRRALNEILANHKLSKTQVSSGRAKPVDNPAVAAKVDELKGVDDQQKRQLAGPDFSVISATLSGTGSLEQVMRTLATLESQKWVHRIESASISKAGREGTDMELKVALATAFFPGVKPASSGEADGKRWVVPADGGESKWWTIVAKDVFHEPPADKPEPPTAVAHHQPDPGPTQPPPPPPQPYEDWRITGVGHGVSGAELMLRNDKTNEWKTLAVGGTVLDVKFVEAKGETVRIAIGEQVFEVAPGQKLSDRRAVQ